MNSYIKSMLLKALLFIISLTILMLFVSVLFSPILNADKLIFPYVVHPFDIVAKYLGKLFYYLFNIDKYSTYVFIMSMLSGLPSNAFVAIVRSSPPFKNAPFCKT